MVCGCIPLKIYRIRNAAIHACDPRGSTEDKWLWWLRVGFELVSPARPFWRSLVDVCLAHALYTPEGDCAGRKNNSRECKNKTQNPIIFSFFFFIYWIAENIFLFKKSPISWWITSWFTVFRLIKLRWTYRLLKIVTLTLSTWWPSPLQFLFEVTEIDIRR